MPEIETGKTVSRFVLNTWNVDGGKVEALNDGQSSQFPLQEGQVTLSAVSIPQTFYHSNVITSEADALSAPKSPYIKAAKTIGTSSLMSMFKVSVPTGHLFAKH